MNTLGFFVCWIIIGVFVRLTRGWVIKNWKEQKFDKKHQDAIDGKIDDMESEIDDFMNTSESNMRFVVLIIALVNTMEIIAWPIALIIEFVSRLQLAKNADD